MLTKILFAALLAQAFAITPRRRALKRVDVPKAWRGRHFQKRPRAARGTARGATPQGRQATGEDDGQATTGVETRRGGGGGRSSLFGRGQEAGCVVASNLKGSTRTGL